MTESKRSIDWEAIVSVPTYAGITVSERGLVDAFVAAHKKGLLEDRLPHTAMDSVVREFSFRFGRADVVIFHVDGSATVIEAKDGSMGYRHVVAGIGQAALYATQLAMNKGALRKVRRALMWTSTGDVELDALIEIACEQSGTVPLPWQSSKKMAEVYGTSVGILKDD